MPPAEPFSSHDQTGPADSSFLFPWPPRKFRWARPVQLILRTIHIAAMAFVLGGVAFNAPGRSLALPMVLTAVSGILLLAVDVARSGVFLYLAAGLAVHLKVALLLLGVLLPEARLGFTLAATVVASIGSHMSGAFRHYSFFHGRVLEQGGKRRDDGQAD